MSTLGQLGEPRLSLKPAAGNQPLDGTLDFGLVVIGLYKKLPRSVISDVIGRQLLRCATSVGAQYREAIRARSRAEFASKMESALQELEESDYWLLLLERSEQLPANMLKPISSELNEIRRMMIASINTVKQNGGLKPR